MKLMKEHEVSNNQHIWMYFEMKSTFKECIISFWQLSLPQIDICSLQVWYKTLTILLSSHSRKKSWNEPYSY